MRKTLLVLFVAAAAALLQAGSSPAASGDRVMTLGSGQDMITQTLDGTVTNVVPEPVWDVNFQPASDGSFVLSPEYAKDGEAPGVWLVHPDGQSSELNASAEDFNVAISYDGSKVAFARGRPNGSSDIYTVNADGSNLKMVASGKGVNTLRYPEFSPDGGTIAYWCSPSSSDLADWKANCGPLMDGSYATSGVVLMNAGGSNPRLIVVGGWFIPSRLAWSPDGQLLSLEQEWVTSLGGGQYGGSPSQIFAYHTDGSDLFNLLDSRRLITHETVPYGAAFPSFSPDGTRVLYMRWIDDKGNDGNFPYIINRDGTGERELSLQGHGLWWFIPPPTGGAPPPTIDATKVVVPRVRRLAYKAAKARIRKAHLRVGAIHRRVSSSIPRNHVISQHPRAGVHLHRYDTVGPPVNLVVSRGARR